MRESKTEEIDGIKVTVQQMPVKRSIKLMHKLARAGVPAMLKAIGSAKLEDLAAEAGGSVTAALLGALDLSNFGEAAAMLFEKFSEQDLDQCMSELLENAIVETADGKTLPALKALDIVITSPFTVVKLLGLALEVNYGDFSAAFRAAAGTFMTKPAAPLKA